MAYEKFLKQHICDNCHVTILQPHSNEFMAYAGWKKCPICGFTKLIKKENVTKQITTIIKS